PAWPGSHGWRSWAWCWPWACARWASPTTSSTWRSGWCWARWRWPPPWPSAWAGAKPRAGSRTAGPASTWSAATGAARGRSHANPRWTQRPASAGRCHCGRGSGFAHELRLQAHRTDAVDLAVDVVVAIHQADAAHLGAGLHHRGGSLDLQVLDDDDVVAIRQRVAVGIAHDCRSFGLGGGGGRVLRRPLMAAFGADQQVTVLIGVAGAALRAVWEGTHRMFRAVDQAPLSHRGENQSGSGGGSSWRTRRKRGKRGNPLPVNPLKR